MEEIWEWENETIEGNGIWMTECFAKRFISALCLSLSLSLSLYIYIHIYINVYVYIYVYMCGLGSSVTIASDLRTERFGIESRKGRDIPPVQTGHGAQPASCNLGTVFYPGVKCRRGVLLTTHSLLGKGKGKVKS